MKCIIRRKPRPGDDVYFGGGTPGREVWFKTKSLATVFDSKPAAVKKRWEIMDITRHESFGSLHVEKA